MGVVRTVARVRSLLMLQCKAISDAHSGEGGGGAPHHLGPGRWSSWAVDVTADARQYEDGGGEGVGGRDAVLGGERAQHLDLEFGEHDLRRQFGLVAPEESHEEEAPRNNHIDGFGAGEARGGAVDQFLDLAAGLEDPVPVLDAQAPSELLDDPAALVGRVRGQGGEQHPANWRRACGRALLLHEHARAGVAFLPGRRSFTVNVPNPAMLTDSPHASPSVMTPRTALQPPRPSSCEAISTSPPPEHRQ